MNTRYTRDPEFIKNQPNFERSLTQEFNEYRTLIQQPNSNLDNAIRMMTHYFRACGRIPVPDDIFDLLRQRDTNLFRRLEEERVLTLRAMLNITDNAPIGATPATAMRALQMLLDWPFFSNQSLVDVISAYPTLVNEIMAIKYQSTGNTLLHQLIIEKELNQFKAYLSAVYQAKQAGASIPFDAEKKNQGNKTILQLALETGNKDIVSAVLVYANPSRTAHESQIASLNINIPEIMRQQQNLLLETTSAINRRQQIMSHVQQQTLANVGVLAIQQANTDAQVQQIGYVTAVNTAAVQAIEHHVGVQLTLPLITGVRVEELPDQTTSASLPQPEPRLQIANQPVTAETTATNNPSRLFTITQTAPAQENRLTQLRNARAQNNALTQIRNIRAEMNTLRDEIQERSNRLNQLEQRIIQIEAMLTNNNRENTTIRATNM